MELLNGERVLAFDLETTGISTSRDRIVQLALIGSDADGSELSYDRLVNPRRPIPYESQRIHGISDSDVRGEPDFSAIADEVAALIQGSVLVGHNVRKFDMPMLRNEFLRIGALPPEPKAILDTLEMVRRLKLPRPHRLGSQCARHGISLENAHTAAADAAAAAARAAQTFIKMALFRFGWNATSRTSMMVRPLLFAKDYPASE